MLELSSNFLAFVVGGGIGDSIAPKVETSGGQTKLTCPPGTAVQVVTVGNTVVVGCTPVVDSKPLQKPN